MLQLRYVSEHTNVERILRGTWCTPKTAKVVEKGRCILKIHEVWHSQKINASKDTNTWLKMRQEASGGPSHVRTEKELR